MTQDQETNTKLAMWIRQCPEMSHLVEELYADGGTIYDGDLVHLLELTRDGGVVENVDLRIDRAAAEAGQLTFKHGYLPWRLLRLAAVDAFQRDTFGVDAIHAKKEPDMLERARDEAASCSRNLTALSTVLDLLRSSDRAVFDHEERGEVLRMTQDVALLMLGQHVHAMKLEAILDPDARSVDRPSNS